MLPNRCDKRRLRAARLGYSRATPKGFRHLLVPEQLYSSARAMIRGRSLHCKLDGVLDREHHFLAQAIEQAYGQGLITASQVKQLRRVIKEANAAKHSSTISVRNRDQWQTLVLADLVAVPADLDLLHMRAFNSLYGDLNMYEGFDCSSGVSGTVGHYESAVFEEVRDDSFCNEALCKSSHEHARRPPSSQTHDEVHNADVKESSRGISMDASPFAYVNSIADSVAGVRTGLGESRSACFDVASPGAEKEPRFDDAARFEVDGIDNSRWKIGLVAPVDTTCFSKEEADIIEAFLCSSCLGDRSMEEKASLDDYSSLHGDFSSDVHVTEAAMEKASLDDYSSLHGDFSTDVHVTEAAMEGASLRDFSSLHGDTGAPPLEHLHENSETMIADNAFAEDCDEVAAHSEFDLHDMESKMVPVTVPGDAFAEDVVEELGHLSKSWADVFSSDGSVGSLDDEDVPVHDNDIQDLLDKESKVVTVAVPGDAFTEDLVEELGHLSKSWADGFSRDGSVGRLDDEDVTEVTVENHAPHNGEDLHEVMHDDESLQDRKLHGESLVDPPHDDTDLHKVLPLENSLQEGAALVADSSTRWMLVDGIWSKDDSGIPDTARLEVHATGVGHALPTLEASASLDVLDNGTYEETVVKDKTEEPDLALVPFLVPCELVAKCINRSPARTLSRTYLDQTYTARAMHDEIACGQVRAHRLMEQHHQLLALLCDRDPYFAAQVAKEDALSRRVAQVKDARKFMANSEKASPPLPNDHAAILADKQALFDKDRTIADLRQLNEKLSTALRSEREAARSLATPHKEIPDDDKLQQYFSLLEGSVTELMPLDIFEASSVHGGQEEITTTVRNGGIAVDPLATDGDDPSFTFDDRKMAQMLHLEHPSQLADFDIDFEFDERVLGTFTSDPDEISEKLNMEKIGIDGSDPPGRPGPPPGRAAYGPLGPARRSRRAGRRNRKRGGSPPTSTSLGQRADARGSRSVPLGPPPHFEQLDLKKPVFDHVAVAVNHQADCHIELDDLPPLAEDRNG